MGHVTVIGKNLTEVKAIAKEVKNKLKVIA
jgi:hypothetical protein